MEKIRKDNRKGNNFVREFGLLNKGPFVNDRWGGFGKRVRKKIPGEKTGKNEKKIIGNRDINKILENKTDNQHLQKGI